MLNHINVIGDCWKMKFDGFRFSENLQGIRNKTYSYDARGNLIKTFSLDKTKMQNIIEICELYYNLDSVPKFHRFEWVLSESDPLNILLL